MLKKLMMVVAGATMALGMAGQAGASTYGKGSLRELHEDFGSENSVLHADSVRAHTADIYTYRFTAGELVTIAVSGDGDTDLDLVIETPGGRVIASDLDSTDDCRVTFRAPYSGRYRIKVKNLGGVYNRYLMFVA
jgi:hypothetical protein